MKKLISAIIIIFILFSFASCGEPSLNGAQKAAETYIKSTEPSGIWKVWSDAEKNIVIVKFTYDDYYINPDAASQDNLDWWNPLIEKFAGINMETKAAMDETGYIADCEFYVFDSSRPETTLLYVVNGVVSYNYLENAKNIYITLEKYNQISMGMKLNEVRNLIGSPGELLSAVDLDIGYEYVTEVYVWYAADGIGNASITFQGGKVVAMAQFGLT